MLRHFGQGQQVHAPAGQHRRQRRRAQVVEPHDEGHERKGEPVQRDPQRLGALLFVLVWGGTGMVSCK